MTGLMNESRGGARILQESYMHARNYNDFIDPFGAGESLPYREFQFANYVASCINTFIGVNQV